jgi:stage V sporulation protein B
VKKLFQAVALITFFSILNRAAGFVFRIYLSRTIGAEALGLYQIALSIFFVLLTFVASGLPLIISRNTAKYSTLKDYKKERSLMSASLIFSVILSVVLSICVIIFKDVFKLLFTDEKAFQILLILLPAVLITAIFTVFRGWLWGKNNFFAVCFTEFVEQIVRIVLCVILLSSAFSFDGANAAALSLTLSCAFSLVLIIIFYFTSGGRFAKPESIYKEVVKPSTPITLVRVLTSLVQPVIAIIIPLRLVAAGYTNSQALSLYGVAMGMTVPFLFIPSAIIGSLSMALIPDLSSAVTKQDTGHISNRITTSLLFTMLVSTLFVPLYIGAGQEIGIFFYDNILSGNLLVYSAWFMIPFGLTSISSSILNALGLELKSMKNYIVGAVIMLLCVWFLPAYIGINALVWGMGICMVIAGFLNIRMIKKKTKINLKFLKPFLLMLAFIVPVTALVSFITKILANYFNLFFTLAISCTVGAICFMLLAFVFNLISVDSIMILFKRNKKEKQAKREKRKTHLPSLFFFKISNKKSNKKRVVIHPN